MGSVCSPNVYLKGYHGPTNEKLMDLVGIKSSEVEAEFGISFASLVLSVWVAGYQWWEVTVTLWEGGI